MVADANQLLLGQLAVAGLAELTDVFRRDAVIPGLDELLHRQRRVATVAHSAHVLGRDPVIARFSKVFSRESLVAQIGEPADVIGGDAVLWTQDTGYDRRNVLMFSIDAGHTGKRGSEARQIYQRVLDELRLMPAAHAVTLSIVRPVSDLYTVVDRVTEAGGRPLPGDEAVRTVVDLVAPGYFETMNIPLLAGRDFDARDTSEAPKVAIVTDLLARHFHGNPVGQRLTLGEDDVREIVGVAADTRYATVKDTPREVLYLPFFQSTAGFTPTYEIKYVGVPADVLRAAGDAVGRIDPALAIVRAKTLEVQTNESLARERLLAWWTTYCGAFAWLLAGIGLYGLLSYTVTERTPELGLRMALGAQPTGIRMAVMRESLGTVLVGLAAGLGAAFRWSV